MTGYDVGQLLKFVSGVYDGTVRCVTSEDEDGQLEFSPLR